MKPIKWIINYPWERLDKNHLPDWFFKPLPVNIKRDRFNNHLRLLREPIDILLDETFKNKN